MLLAAIHFGTTAVLLCIAAVLLGLAAGGMLYHRRERIADFKEKLEEDADYWKSLRLNHVSAALRYAVNGAFGKAVREIEIARAIFRDSAQRAAHEAEVRDALIERGMKDPAQRARIKTLVTQCDKFAQAVEGAMKDSGLAPIDAAAVLDAVAAPLQPAAPAPSVTINHWGASPVVASAPAAAPSPASPPAASA